MGDPGEDAPAAIGSRGAPVGPARADREAAGRDAGVMGMEESWKSGANPSSRSRARAVAQLAAAWLGRDHLHPRGAGSRRNRPAPVSDPARECDCGRCSLHS